MKMFISKNFLFYDKNPRILIVPESFDKQLKPAIEDVRHALTFSFAAEVQREINWIKSYIYSKVYNLTDTIASKLKKYFNIKSPMAAETENLGSDYPVEEEYCYGNRDLATYSTVLCYQALIDSGPIEAVVLEWEQFKKLKQICNEKQPTIIPGSKLGTIGKDVLKIYRYCFRGTDLIEEMLKNFRHW